MVFVKKSGLRRLGGILTEAFDRLAPGCLLSAIELAQGKNVPPQDTPSRDAAAFDDTPVEVLFAILAAFFTAEEHS
jgi:hypothetical protein